MRLRFVSAEAPIWRSPKPPELLETESLDNAALRLIPLNRLRLVAVPSLGSTSELPIAYDGCQMNSDNRVCWYCASYTTPVPSRGTSKST